MRCGRRWTSAAGCSPRVGGRGIPGVLDRPDGAMAEAVAELVSGADAGAHSRGLVVRVASAPTGAEPRRGARSLASPAARREARTASIVVSNVGCAWTVSRPAASAKAGRLASSKAT